MKLVINESYEVWEVGYAGFIKVPVPLSEISEH